MRQNFSISERTGNGGFPNGVDMTETIEVQKEKSRENEQALLGAVMRDGSIYERARELVQAKDFDWGCYGWAWEACETLWKQGMHIDTITVGNDRTRRTWGYPGKGKPQEFYVLRGEHSGLFGQKTDYAISA